MISITEAFVEFDKSRIYDETDFDGVSTVALPNYCDVGCRIYASVPEASADIAHPLRVFEMKKKHCSLLDISRTPENKKVSQQLTHSIQQGNAGINFINNNANQASAPILVWIVRSDAPNIDTADVYDADEMNRPAAAGGPITILNAAPYILSTETSEGKIIVRAIAAGFDALNAIDQCTEVISQNDPSTYQDVRIGVRSPLITLLYDFATYPTTSVVVKASQSDNAIFDLSLPAFITSPGYIGCETKEVSAIGTPTKTYRSALYDALPDYQMDGDQEYTIDVSAELNVDAAHPVDLTFTNENGDRQLSWFVSASDGSNAKTTVVSAKALTVNWTRDQDILDQYFLIKIKQTTSVPGPEKTATIEQEAEPTQTTTIEPEAEPTQTTTIEPAAEPTQTTTIEPAAEPTQTTT
ncbi:hypothetical protein PFISCL1PPCAC_18766, partial [Pristionchus fissidentatus]